MTESVSDLTVVVPYMGAHCNVLRDLIGDGERMTKYWSRLAQHDVGFLDSLLLAACRHLSEKHHNQEFFRQLAIQYKLASVRLLNEAISAAISPVSDSTISTVLMLAFDEVRLTNLGF